MADGLQAQSANVLHHASISRAHDLVRIDELFKAVGAPADDARDGKNRRVKLDGNAEHAVYKTAVKIDVQTAMRMTKAVAVHTTMVSTNTPRDWIRPCWTGWATVAVAAALGAVP